MKVRMKTNYLMIRLRKYAQFRLGTHRYGSLFLFRLDCGKFNIKIFLEKAETNQISRVDPTKQDILQFQDVNNETADHVADDQINEQEFHFYEISNLVSTENTKNLNHGKRKRKTQYSNEDNLEKLRSNNKFKKNKEQIKVIV